MSDIERRDSGAVAIPDDSMTGLEDFDVETDSVMPRLKIDGKTATFEDNLTGEHYPEITVILLGLVKQRILWAEEVAEGEGPLCRSLDFQKGLPFVKEFPWKASGFSAPAVGTEDVDLECGSCALKEWGTNPTSKTPWCSEQHTYPLMMQSGDGLWVPAILTLQRSGIKPSKAYVSSYVRAKQPLYTAVTKISLQAMKRGSVDYAVPVLAKMDPTDPDEWPMYAMNYRQIRTFLQTPRMAEDEAATVAAAATSAPAYADDDEPPF